MKESTESKDVFISKATVVDPASPFHKKKVDVLVANGRIEKIGSALKDPFGAEFIEGKSLYVSPGFADLHVNVQDPGYEYKEDIYTALKAAASGGFTGILSCSSTHPCIDGKAGIEYQLRKAKGCLTDLWVSGSISKGQEGKELAEMYDMHEAGALAFGDFKSEIRDSQLLKLSLLYVKSFNGLIMVHPSEHYLSSGGEVNEGVMSTHNGLRGIPAIAEEIGINRALKLAEYTDQAIHLTSISTKEGVDLVKKARKKGLRVTCGVSVANLIFDEKNLNHFDTNFKVYPPLRTEKDRKALIDGVIKGVIDVVVSDHWPQNIEGKECEFDEAAYGMNTLESTFAMLNTALKGKCNVSELVEIMSVNPRKILGLEIPTIKEKEKANLSIFQVNEKFTFPEKSASKSSNRPAFRDLTGNIKAVVNNKQVHVNP